jgi:uncharacterized protein involved in response to NO
VLPAFCGAGPLFSPRVMFASLATLSLGCTLRVVFEVLAYEGYWSPAWSVLPASAIIELTAVTLFGANLALTLFLPERARHIGVARRSHVRYT